MNTTVRSKSMLDATKPGPNATLNTTKNLDTTQQPMVLRQRQVNPGIPSSPARSQSVQGPQALIQENSNPSSTPKRSAPLVPISRTPIMNRPAPGPPLPRPVLPRERGYMDRVVEYLVSFEFLFISKCVYGSDRPKRCFTVLPEQNRTSQ
jgi:hypothetical protein